MRNFGFLRISLGKVLLVVCLLLFVAAANHQWQQYKWRTQAAQAYVDQAYAPSIDEAQPYQEGQVVPESEAQLGNVASVFTVCGQWSESLVVFAFEQSDYSKQHPEEPLQYHDILMLYVSIYNEDWTRVKQRVDASSPDQVRELWLKRLFEVINNPTTGCFGDLEKQRLAPSLPQREKPQTPVRKRRMGTRPDAYVASGLFYWYNFVN